MDRFAGFDPKAVTNIVSQSLLEQRYRITYDSAAKTFVVHMGDGKTIEFMKNEFGLYAYYPEIAGVADEAAIAML